MEIVRNQRANSDIEHHIFANINAVPNLLPKLNVTARHWIVLRKEDGSVGGGGGGGWGS